VGPVKYTLQPGKTTEKWTIAAKTAGNQEIVVTSGNVGITIGMKVLSNQFFGPTTMLILSGVSWVLGPMLTVPWWIDLYRRRKDKAATNKGKRRNTNEPA
jgi:hypothetical protein